MGKTKEAFISKIKYLRSLERIRVANGVIIGSGDIRMFYDFETGRVYTVVQNKIWGWKIRGNGEEGERYTKGYLKRQIPGTRVHVMSHHIACVALGLYDDDKNLGLEVNHKNYNKADNRPQNLELCTRTENEYHRKLRDILIKHGVWRDEMAFEAKFARQAILESKGDTLTLLRMVDDYLRSHGYF